MRVGILGGTGCLGSCLAARNTDFTVIKSRLENTLELEIELRRAKITTLINFAGRTDVKWCESNKDLAYVYNAQVLDQLVEIFARNGGENFIQASTAHVYKTSKEFNLISAYSEVDPSTTYAKTKMLAEEIITRQCSNLGINYLIARIFSVLDRNLKSHFFLPSLLKRIQEKNFSKIDGMNKVRDFLTADEVAIQFENLINAGYKNGIVNVCSGTGTPLRVLVKKTFECAGLDADQIFSFQDTNELDDFLVGNPHFARCSS